MASNVGVKMNTCFMLFLCVCDIKKTLLVNGNMLLIKHVKDKIWVYTVHGTVCMSQLVLMLLNNVFFQVFRIVSILGKTDHH